MLFSSLSKKRKQKFIKYLCIKKENVELPLVSDYQYLGVILDDAFRFTKHMNMIKKSILYRMYILRKVPWQIGFKDSLLLYKSGILAFLTRATYFSMQGVRNC